MPGRPRSKQRTQRNPTELAKLVFPTVRAARDSLPPEQRDAYLSAQQSVVDARRSAERNEGPLRIN